MSDGLIELKIDLPQDLARRLEAQAESQGCTLESLMAAWLEDYLAKQADKSS